MDSNNQSYNSSTIVSKYRKQKYLYPAEITALKELTPVLTGSNSSFLDIGCGTGRTTHYFSHLCNEYIGVDYAENMIKYCKENFKEDNCSFYQCDARDMSRFANNHFTAVLFSFNGIDCISYSERLLVLSEVARILKPGGYFIFSSHNTRNLNRKYRFRFPKNPFNFPQEISRLKKINTLNGTIEQFKYREYFSLYDGAENFTTQNVYVLPELQIRLLEEKGLQNVRLIDTRNGQWLEANNLADYTEPWLYYSAQKE